MLGFASSAQPTELPQNLLADNANLGQTETGTSGALRAAAQALFDEVQPHLGFDQGDITMFVMDLPDVPPQYAPVVIAEAKQAQKGIANTERTIGVCHLIDAQPESRLSAYNSMSPVLGVWDYLKKQERLTPEQLTVEMFNAAKVSVLQAPAHGELKDVGYQSFSYYLATPNYRGPDHATLLVEIGAYKVNVLYFFNVLGGVPGGTDNYDPYEDKKLCPNGAVWKISLNPDDPNAPIYTFQHPSQLTSYLAGAINGSSGVRSLTPDWGASADDGVNGYGER